jgi:hypothetical protein
VQSSIASLVFFGLIKVQRAKKGGRIAVHSRTVSAITFQRAPAKIWMQPVESLLITIYSNNLMSRFNKRWHNSAPTQAHPMTIRDKAKRHFQNTLSDGLLITSSVDIPIHIIRTYFVLT